MKRWNMRRGWPSVMIRIWLAAVILLAGISLWACHGKSAGTAQNDAVMAETQAAAGSVEYAPRDEMAMAAAPLPEGDYDTLYMQLDGASGEEEIETLEMGTGEGLSSSADTDRLTASGRKLIRDVNMNVEARDFDGVLSQITGKVSELGGYVESSDVSGVSVNTYGGSQQRYADIKVRIPADKLDRFVETVERAGNVTSRQEQVTDVTLQYSDVQSRKKSLEIEQERLWALLEKAESLDAVVALESRLSEIRYELESYTSQLRLFDNQVDYSTVSIYMVEVKDLTPTAPDSVRTRIQKGFSRSLNNLEETGVDLFVWFVVNSPVLLVLAVIAAAVVFLVRKVSRNMGTRDRFRGRPSESRGTMMKRINSKNSNKRQEAKDKAEEKAGEKAEEEPAKRELTEEEKTGREQAEKEQAEKEQIEKEQAEAGK